MNGPIGGSVLTFTTASAPSGTVLGPDQLFITVTGFISNTSVATNNKVFTNTLSMTYSEDGQPYRFSSVVTGTIREPFLVMTKTGVAQHQYQGRRRDHLHAAHHAYAAKYSYRV